jgi:hypothetical protein
MHDKDETMHLGVKNNTNLNDNKKEKPHITICSSDIEDKKRLVEIYLIISGLIISGVQVSNALISASFNSSNVLTLNAEKYLTDVMSDFNTVFIIFVILILIYYMSFTIEIFNYMDVAPFVALFFSFLIVSILNLQNTIHHKLNNIYMTFGLWIPLFIFSWSTLSSTQQMSNKLFKILNHEKKCIEKINRIAYIKFIIFIIFSYYLVIRMLNI